MNKEQYLLIQLMEECAEVQHACAKALRFGLGCTSIDPIGLITNKEQIQKELVDLMSILYCIQEEKIFPMEYTEEQVLVKHERVHKYMQVSRNLGILE